MRRYALLAALAFSASVHAFLAPAHLREERLLGLLFVAGSILEFALVALLAARPSRAALAASTLALAGMILAYVPFLLFRLPGFAMTPEPLERVAIVTKAVELAGFVVGATLWARQPSLTRRLVPAAATIVSACAVALVAAPPSLGIAMGHERSVDIPSKYFSPDRLTVLTGDTVTWTNHDGTAHTVTAGDFDSGHLDPGSSYSFTFSQAGAYQYHCSIHRYMHGEIDVEAVALDAPGHSVPLGSAVTLTGLAPGGIESVTLEQVQSDGSYRSVAAAPVQADGSFSFQLTASAPSSYRARAGDQVSESVPVTPEATVNISFRRSARGAVLIVTAAPDQAGAHVAVERYLREHYWWKPVRRITLGSNGSATVALRSPEHGTHYRAHLLRGNGGWGEASSRPVTVP